MGLESISTAALRRSHKAFNDPEQYPRVVAELHRRGIALQGCFVFGLDDTALYAVTVLAALPTAQNVFNYAQRYETGEILARDTVFITTLGCLPVLLGLALLLG